MRKFTSFIFINISFLLAVGDKLVTNPGTKIWRTKINFTNPLDWKEKILPRSCDRAIMPPLTSISVNLASNLDVRELVLPLEGEIVLSEGSSLTFGDQTLDCKDSRDVHYVPPISSDWYEPTSWAVSEEVEKNQTIPIPESERVPCQYDSVEFPVNSSYQVIISGPNIRVKSLLIDGKPISTNEFSILEKTSSGKIRFRRSTSLDVTNSSCSGDSGCVCRDEDITGLICQLTKCPEIDCSDPVKPVGACCPLCGAFLLADCKKDFEYSRLKKLYDSYINKEDYKNVYGYLSKLNKDRVQVVFVDNLETHRASSLALELRAVLKTDISGVGIYGISSIVTHISHYWLIHDRYMTKGLSVGGVFGISIAFICLVFLGLFAYVSYEKYGFGSLAHGRLHEEKDSDESDEEQIITPFAPGAGIENPLYDTEKKKELYTEKSDLGDASMEKSGVVSSEMRENPAFIGLEEFQHLQEESLLH